jgi:DNA-binding IclR family transcriptional regulator
MPRSSAVTEDQDQVAPTVVRPVSNAIGILKHLGRSGKAETVTNIARTLNINTSTCFNILRTLVAEGMLVFDESSKTYSVGLGVVQLAQRVLTENGKVDVIRPLLHAVAERHGVTMTLWRFSDGDRNVLASVSQSSSAFQIQMKLGQRLPIYIGAFGRVLAAQNGVSKAELKREFEAMRWARAPDFDQYWADVQRAAETGWALDSGDFAIGVTSIATAVKGPDGHVRHGLVATMFNGQLDTARIEALAQDLLTLASEMEGLS